MTTEEIKAMLSDPEQSEEVLTAAIVYCNEGEKKLKDELAARDEEIKTLKAQIETQKKLETLSELYTKWKSPELMEEVRGKFNEVYGGKEELPAASMGGPEAHFSLDPAEWWQKLVRARAVDKSNRVIDKDTFITTPSGNIDWYHFSEDEKTQASLKKAGLKNIPIRLKIGKQFSKRHNGYGYLHILSHLEDFGESPLLFLYKTLSNICRVMPDPRDGNKSLLFAKDGNEASRLVIQLYEEDGCYSIVSCYPLGKANLIEQNQGLPVGRAVLQPISDSEISPIKNRKARNAAEPTGSAMGEVLGDRLPQKRGVVNIYDVRIVDLAGNVIHEQQFEPRARFSLGGEKSAVFGEYDAQGLTYVDPADGKRKFCIDTAGVRLSRVFAESSNTLVLHGAALEDGRGGAGDISFAADAAVLADGTRMELEAVESLSGTCGGYRSRQAAMGSGDAWIAMGIGALLGWEGVLFSLVAGSFIGLALAGVSRVGFGRPMPFGPALILAAGVWLFYGVQIDAWLRDWMGWY